MNETLTKLASIIHTRKITSSKKVLQEMTTKTHKKLCWSCDGYVHIYEMQCPYCGADLTAVPHGHEQTEQAEESQEEESPRVAPPYSPYGYQEPLQEEREPVVSDEKGEVVEDVENPLASILLLIPGSLFCLLGIGLWLFSKDGMLTFSFKAKYWPLFLIGSLPMLYFGYRSLYNSKKEEPDAIQPFDLTSS